MNKKSEDYREYWRLVSDIKDTLKSYSEIFYKDAKKLRRLLIKKGFIDDNHFIFNDSDNEAWVTNDMLILTDQNCKFLIWFGGYKVCVYRWYEFFDSEEDDEEEYFGSVEKSIKHADWVIENYSDAYPDFRYITRPSLKFLLDWLATNRKEFYLFHSIYEVDGLENFPTCALDSLFGDLQYTIDALKEEDAE